MLRFIERLPLLHEAQAVLRESHLIIVAAAGYGKSVLLNQLVSYLPNAAYLRLTIEDNDGAVLQQRVANVGAETLLLDDVHLLSADSDSTAWLKSQLETIDKILVVAGRYLPLDTTLLLTEGMAQQWDEVQLAFSAEMTAQFLNDEGNQWQTKLAGWPLGIAMLRQLPSKQRRTDVAKEQLFSYLARSVLDQLPESLQRFLTITAVPMQFSVELATHLLSLPLDVVQALLDTIQQRNLFLIDDGEGWFRYHDLFAEFLASSNGERRNQLLRLAAAWFAQHDHVVMAIEHFLIADDEEAARDLMRDASEELLSRQSRYQTYRRWIAQLSDNVLTDDPDLLLDYLQNIQYEPSYREEAQAYFELLHSAETPSDELRHRITFQEAQFHLMQHNYPRVIELVTPLLDTPYFADKRRITALQTVAVSHAEQMQLMKARHYFEEAAQLAKATGNRQRIGNVTQNMMVTTLLSAGEYALAAERSAMILNWDDVPDYWRVRYLIDACELWFCVGDTERFEAAVEQAESLVDSVEHITSIDKDWLRFYRILLNAVLKKQLTDVDSTFLTELDDVSESQRIVRTALLLFVARQQTDLAWADEVASIARVMAHDLTDHAFDRGRLALDADIVAGLLYVDGQRPSFQLSPLTASLVGWRCAGELLRLNALLALVCWKSGDRRWRRRARQALRGLKRPLYERLLTVRDQPLGVQFWMMLVREGLAVERASAALVEIGLVEPVVTLLTNDSAEIRQLTASILAKIGDEKAMDGLNRAISAETDPPTKQALQAALQILESQPPPSLHIQLMDGFSVRRGVTAIANFHRPIVARLLQYFAIHHGRSIPRDQILEALWPDTTPDKAWTTFRTVYSRLRNALEPHMRSNGPNRYFALDGDSYIFDPHGYVTTDIIQFETAITDALATNRPVANRSITLLTNYAPILPELPYADWLLETRETRS